MLSVLQIRIFCCFLPRTPWASWISKLMTFTRFKKIGGHCFFHSFWILSTLPLVGLSYGCWTICCLLHLFLPISLSCSVSELAKFGFGSVHFAVALVKTFYVLEFLVIFVSGYIGTFHLFTYFVLYIFFFNFVIIVTLKSALGLSASSGKLTPLRLLVPQPSVVSQVGAISVEYSLLL